MRLRTRDLPVFPVSAGPVRPGVDPGVKAVDPRSFAMGPADGPRLGLVTLGCDKNTVDSEHMMAALVATGARVTSDVENADVVVVNTCGFIDAAREQSIDTILAACELKARGQVRAVAAVGCMVQRYREELEREIPEVDLFLGIAEMARLVPELRARGYVGDSFVPTMERPLRILSTETRHTSFLKVSEGCDHRCAFCAIPHMRGLHRSADLDALVAEARALGRQGVRELNLVSQDTTWYGRDLRRRDPAAPLLQDLLEALLEGTEVDWYRLLYMYPSGITPALVDLIAGQPRLIPYLDMPLQHGSDAVLARMRRPERQATVRERVRWLRDSIDDLTLRTTVIVGFPGETDEDVRIMMDFLEEIRFDRVGAFAYSIEEGTAAAAMPDQVPEEVKAERLDRVMEHQRDLSLECNLRRVGTRAKVMVDELVPDAPGHDAAGRTQGQAPEVDGRTFLTGARGIAAGDIVDVEIVDADDYDLTGRLIGA